MLTKQQYKLLKKIAYKDKSCEELSETENNIISFLISKHYIERYCILLPNSFMEHPAVHYCRITESGKIELVLCKQERYHFWIPTALSIIAIIASFLAIFTQNGELWIWLKELLQ